MSSSSLTDKERVAALHELPLFLPSNHVYSNILPKVVLTILLLTISFSSCIVLMGSLTDLKALKLRRLCYQIVSCQVNGILGILGIYHYLHRVTLPSNAETVEERVTTSLENHESICWLACIQLGCQLWALPVGHWFVKETTPMLCHHMAVIGVASLSAFFTNGFVFHNPYFFGLMELSSVPLAVMNVYKDNENWRKAHPQVYALSRVSFGAAFLFIRIYMMIPRKYDFLRLSFYAAQTSPYLWYQVFLGLCWMGSFFLACLQCFWATLIVKGLVKMLPVKTKKKKTV